MKQITYAITTAVVAIALTFSSCSKLDWKPWKDHGGGKFPISDCDVERVYAQAEGGGIDLHMEKTYYGNGRVKTIGFYTFSAVSAETYWHSFRLNYNPGALTVDIIDSASGEAVLMAVFNSSGRLEELQRLQGETSDFANRNFNYVGGRLQDIYTRWKTFDFTESFVYDADGNISRRETSDAGGITDDLVYHYGAAATDKKQFYMPSFNDLIVADPSMALVQYLGWLKEFSPKNILTSIEYLQPLPHTEEYTGHVFDGSGKLTSYSTGDFVGGTKYIDWRCSKH